MSRPFIRIDDCTSVSGTSEKIEIINSKRLMLLSRECNIMSSFLGSNLLTWKRNTLGTENILSCLQSKLSESPAMKSACINKNKFVQLRRKSYC